MSELTRLSVVELAGRIAAGEASATEAVQAALARIDMLDGALHAFLTVDAPGALAAAARADAHRAAGGELGPLHGVPVGVKDLEDTAGLQTTYGTRAYADHVPEADSILVERLRKAGAIVIGKTNTPAFGLMGEVRNALGEDRRNPWDTTCCTGGSSGGSAVAVATGMVALATGTDSAGSITCPAAMCGLFGVKPTHGRVPMVPNWGDSLTFNDGGPLTRTVADAALMLEVLSGHDARDPASLREGPPALLAGLDTGVAGLRLGFSADLGGHFAVDADVAALAKATFLTLVASGAVPVKLDVSLPDPWTGYGEIYTGDALHGLGAFVTEHGSELLPETRAELDGWERLTAAELAHAWFHLRAFRAAAAALFDRVDVLCTPATATAAFPCGQPPSRIGGRDVEPGWASFMPFSVPWNATGQTTASVPAGRTAAGLPVGLLLIARHGAEDVLRRAARTLERLAPWATSLPVLPETILSLPGAPRAANPRGVQP